jgi:oligosaccharide reducing-end xylanase
MTVTFPSNNLNPFIQNLLFSKSIRIILVLLLAGNAFILGMTTKTPVKKKGGAYFTGIYSDLFSELLGLNELTVKAKIDSAFEQLFYGEPNNQQVYYPVDPDMAYIKDILNNDVRTEGMSYGMMIAVQLNKKSAFDRLWKWSKTYMQHQTGARKGYFAWHCKSDGSQLNPNSAADGEEWFVMALLFASARWGDGAGIFNYHQEAQAILDAMLHKSASASDKNVATNMFNKKEKLVVFVPTKNVDSFTDPSYHVPHFYELWARWADQDNQFWCEAATASRNFLKRAAHPLTGLMPDYTNFDGTALESRWGGGHANFQYDAWRVAMNIALDYSWFAEDEWAVLQSNRLLDFFYSQGIGSYGDRYTLDGKKLSNNHSDGLVAMNAVAALAATHTRRKEFVAELWNMSVPEGDGRYYDGLLYLLALLQVSGNFRIYDFGNAPIPNCQNITR